MNTYIIETEQQLIDALSVRRRVFINEQNVDESLEFDEYDTLGACTHIAISENGATIATARITPYGEKTCKYQRIAIDKEYRGKGLGHVLMNKLDEIAKALGYAHTIISAQTYAEGFYKKAGFTTSNSEIFMDANIPHIKMEKDIV